jgi:hypothetical protein
MTAMMTSIWKHSLPIVLLLAGLLLDACSSPSEVVDRQQTLFVEAYLSPGVDPEIHLQETIPPERYYEGLETPVSGAHVTLRTDDRTVSLSEQVDRSGTYGITHAMMPIEEGRTYYLTATHGERQLQAHTTVPVRAPVTRIDGDTITYQQSFANAFGDLLHPGQFFWDRSPTAAGYIIIVEAEWVSSLGADAEPLTAELDTIIAQRQRLEGVVDADSLVVLDERIRALESYFAANISLEGPDERTAQWLRDHDQEDWEEIQEDADSRGELWRDQRDDLYWGRVLDYWIPADTLRSDFWWFGVRFTGDYRITLQSADTNYFDYYTTAFNGQSGADGDAGPIFHTEGGLGVFGSYSHDSFTIFSQRQD